MIHIQGFQSTMKRLLSLKFSLFFIINCFFFINLSHAKEITCLINYNCFGSKCFKPEDNINYGHQDHKQLEITFIFSLHKDYVFIESMDNNLQVVKTKLLKSVNGDFFESKRVYTKQIKENQLFNFKIHEKISVNKDFSNIKVFRRFFYPSNNWDWTKSKIYHGFCK